MTLGNTFVFLSCIAYAIYVNLTFSVVAKNGGEANFDMSCFLGFVGFFFALAGFVFMFIFNALGLETFEWPD